MTSKTKITIIIIENMMHLIFNTNGALNNPPDIYCTYILNLTNPLIPGQKWACPNNKQHLEKSNTRSIPVFSHFYFLAMLVLKNL